MGKTIGTILFILSVLLLIIACGNSSRKKDMVESIDKQVFLIGKGPNSKETIKDMIQKSEIRKGGYVVIVAMFDNKQDSTAYFLRTEFYEQQIMAVHILDFYPDDIVEETDILTIENASIIYIMTGNRNKFIKLANKTLLKNSLLKAYKNGGLIAGKGNGASILGSSYYQQISDTGSNGSTIVLRPGLGLLKNTVVDDINFFNNFKDGIQKNSIKRKFVFLGFGYKSAVWIINEEALVMRKPEIGFISPYSKIRQLNKGDRFTMNLK